MARSGIPPPPSSVRRSLAAGLVALLLGVGSVPTAAQDQRQGCDLVCQGLAVVGGAHLDDAVVANPDLDVGTSSDIDPDLVVAGDDGLFDASAIDPGIVVDRDEDGLSDAAEATYATDPANPDTDFDGLLDGDEVDVYGTLPFTADTDGDGLGDATELFATGTNPRASDTDGDAFGDGDELNRYGTDPNDAASYPDAPVNGRW